ncbi:MAG: SLBB domain-containing protein, partial [Burkholderiaceae bacterium]|nr:SLBB domain-containing protein [Burkholderiaceae bacterium]
VKMQQQSQLDELVNRAEQELLRSAVNIDASAATTESAILNRAQQQNQQALLSRMRRISATGRVVLGLLPSASVSDLPDIALVHGDRIYVPSQPSLVNVFGSVFNQNSFIYKSGTNLADYLSQAGGATKDADEDSIYLLRVDGTVVSRRQRSWFGGLNTETILPGDAIFVPPDLERYALTREFKDWTQILYQFALGVAGLKILRD